MDFHAMMDSPLLDLQDMENAIQAVKGLLLAGCSDGTEMLLPMDFPDEILSTLSHSSGASRHKKFLKDQRKAYKLAKKNRKKFICDLCAMSFRQKEKIVSHMLQKHLSAQKPVAKAGFWYRGVPTQDSNTSRSNLMWRIRMQQDAGTRSHFIYFHFHGLGGHIL